MNMIVREWMGPRAQTWLQRLQYLSGLQWALNFTISWQLCLLTSGSGQNHIWFGVVSWECWGCGALGKQTSPEWCCWPLLTRKQHVFHTVTVTLCDFQSTLWPFCMLVWWNLLTLPVVLILHGLLRGGQHTLHENELKLTGILWCMQWWSKLEKQIRKRTKVGYPKPPQEARK